MKIIWKKVLALTLTLCSVLTVSAPTVSAVNDAVAAGEYVFPAYGPVTQVADEALMGELSITQYAAKVTKDGKDYLIAPDRGGSMYVLKLEDFLNSADNNGSWIEAQISTGVPIPTGMVLDSKDTAYVGGDSGIIFAYNIHTGETASIDLGGYSCQNIAVDNEDNIYVSTTASPTNTILKIETKDGYKVSTFFTSEEFVLITGITYGGGNIYIQGQKRGASQGMRIQKLSMDGQKIGECITEKGAGCYYLDYVDGVVFVGHSGTITEGCVAIDATTMQKIDIGGKDYILGLVTEPSNGKAYMNISGTGIHEYDLATRKVTRVEGLTSINVNLRIKNPYLEVENGQLTGKCIITMASGGAQPILMSLEGKGYIYLDELVEEATSPATTRSIGPGVKGLLVKNHKADTIIDAVPEAEVAVYVGGYLCAFVGSYAPGLDQASRLDSNVFVNNHAQTDCLIEHNGKIYGGAYGGAYLFEYDPATDTFRELITNLYKDYKQMRIHCVVGNGDKIFFSTVPTAQILGGAIGWYDLKTNKATIIPEPVEDQTIISLAYDEKEQLLYCATSIEGGTQTVPTKSEALIMVYDVANNKKLGEFSVRAGTNPSSDMIFNLSGTDQIPTYIAGVATDPNTGKIWGLVSRTLFSMKYDRNTGSLHIHEEWSKKNGIEKSGYPVSGSLNWFPRTFCFDGKGNLYLNLELDGGFYRFNTENPSDFENISTISTRIYCLGADDNLYFTDGEGLYMIALNRVSIVKNMIDGTSPGDWKKVLEARKAYNALTDEERQALGDSYLTALEALEGAAKIFLQVSADKVITAIDEIGVVTASTLGPIAKARQVYDLLEKEAQDLVTNYNKLIESETAFAAIKSKTKWSTASNVTLSFSTLTDSRLTGVLLQDVTYDHTNGGVWKYAFSTGNERSMKFNAGSHLRLIFGDKDYIAFRVRIPAAGVYDLSAKVLDWDRVPDLDGCLGGLYMFPAGNATNNELAEQILSETSLNKPGTENYVGAVDFTKKGHSGSVGKWECTEAGEYLLVVSKLRNLDGAYAYVESFTLSRQDPTLDNEVERVKAKINEIGKVTKKSGDLIKEARTLFNGLTDAQRELIYAPQLEAAEKAYADILANNTDDADATAIALVEIQISAIGQVTVGSGPAIQMAREAYDSLSKKLQKKVANADVLIKAEADYAALLANSYDTGTDGTTTTVIVIIVIAVLAVAGTVTVIILSKKKKAPSNAPTAPQE